MIRFITYDADFVARMRDGGPDAYGNAPERAVSDGEGVPCRCCLRDVPAGETYLIVAARPFSELQPYAETGPIFLCERDCDPWSGDAVPPILTTSPDYLIKGYDGNERIVYGTGSVVSRETLSERVAELTGREEIAFVDIRSARNNCFQTRAVA